MSEDNEEWINLTEGMILCELCSKYFTPERFYEHLKKHSKKEILMLKKLSEKLKDMTEEKTREFRLNLECESLRKARESIEREEEANDREET